MSELSNKIPVPEAGEMYALLGHPVAHSMSPAMHNLSFSALGIDAVYLAFDVGEERLGDTVRVFDNILDRLFRNDALIAHLRCRALAENGLRRFEEGFLKHLLVKIFSLLYLLFKPTHC